MEDDTKLKIILWIIIIMAVAAIIGVWEKFVEPLITFITSHVFLIR